MYINKSNINVLILHLLSPLRALYDKQGSRYGYFLDFQSRARPVVMETAWGKAKHQNFSKKFFVLTICTHGDIQKSLLQDRKKK